MLETLREKTETSSGQPKLRGEMWSIMLHGAGERLSPTLASHLAIAAIAVLAVAGIQWLIVPPAANWNWLVPALSIAAGPVMLSLAASALLRKAGVLTSPAAVGVSVTATLAWSLAMLTALSWTTGFDEADARAPRTLFGELFVPLFLASFLAGTAAIAPVWASLMIRIRRHGARWSLATAAAALTAVPLGVSAATPTLGLAVSIGLLVIAQRMRRGTRDSRPSPPFQALPLTGRRRIVGLATVSAVLGVLSVFFALTGSFWTSVALDGTQAMNLGLGAGSLAAIPVAVASGIAVTRRRGARFWAPTVAFIATLVAVAAGQFAGAGHPLQWPLIVSSAVSLGIAAALVFSRVLPGGRVVRSIAIVGIIVAVAWGAGLFAATLLPFVAPVASIAVVVWAIRSSPSSTPNLAGAAQPVEPVWPTNG